MNASAWIALAALAFTVLTAFGAGVWYLSQRIATLPALTANAVRDHEVSCLNHERHSAVNIQAVEPQL